MNSNEKLNGNTELVARAEEATLGAALVSPNIIPDLLGAVKPHDFMNYRHQIIFNAIYEMWAKGGNISPITLAAELDEKGNLERTGGAPYLFTLYQAAPVISSAVSHAEVVAEQATRRRLEMAGITITQDAWEGDIGDTVSKAQALIDGVYKPSSETVRLVPEHLGGTIDYLEQVAAGKIDKGLDTGFQDLDYLTGGLSGGQMIIVAARPGVGKSTIATDIMRHVSVVNKLPSLIFSLEMSEKEIHQRLIAAESSVNVTSVRNWRLTVDDQKKVERGVERLSNAPIFIDESAETTMMDITAKTKILVKKEGIKLVVIDYLQLLKSGGRSENRQQEVSDFSRQIKLLAKSCNIPIIAVAQLNRGPEQRGPDAMPKISDLRESGSLEQDADMVMLLHRPDSQDKDSPRAGEVDVNLAKNRGGSTGIATLAHQLHYSRFMPLGRGL